MLLAIREQSYLGLIKLLHCRSRLQFLTIVQCLLTVFWGQLASSYIIYRRALAEWQVTSLLRQRSGSVGKINWLQTCHHHLRHYTPTMSSIFGHVHFNQYFILSPRLWHIAWICRWGKCCYSQLHPNNILHLPTCYYGTRAWAPFPRDLQQWLSHTGYQGRRI